MKSGYKSENKRDGEMGPRPNAAARARVRLKNGSENEYGNEHWGVENEGRNYVCSW